MINPFFKNYGPFEIEQLLDLSDINNTKKYMSIIKVINLEKHYPSPENSGKSFAAVNKINLSINPGEIFGLLGPNGAGKTSTLEMLEGLSVIENGEVIIDNINALSGIFLPLIYFGVLITG